MIFHIHEYSLLFTVKSENNMCFDLGRYHDDIPLNGGDGGAGGAGGNGGNGADGIGYNEGQPGGKGVYN